MRAIKEKNPDTGTFFGHTGYSSYQVIKSQLRYFYRERKISEAQKGLLERPHYVTSFRLPATKTIGGKSTINGYLVKHGRRKESFLVGIIFDPKITEERLKAIALSAHLQARLAGIQLEPVLLGIAQKREILSTDNILRIENDLEKNITGHLSFVLSNEEYYVENGEIYKTRIKKDKKEVYVRTNVPANSNLTVELLSK